MKKRKGIIINGYIKRVGIGLLVSLMIVVAICLINSNYRNIGTFSNVLFYFGAVELSLGGIGFVGGTMIKGDIVYQLARTATNESGQNRTSKDMDNTGQKFYSAIYMSIIGALLVGFSIIVQYILL
ncbi:hypothetical protein [Clostridium sp.]|jgi:hypothetical protein|uniref:hypothetical protein n=1 Tax=Clostridium sp. TaxID=1506 RepID=UPI003EEC29D4